MTGFSFSNCENLQLKILKAVKTITIVKVVTDIGRFQRLRDCSERGEKRCLHQPLTRYKL